MFAAQTNYESVLAFAVYMRGVRAKRERGTRKEFWAVKIHGGDVHKPSFVDTEKGKLS